MFGETNSTLNESSLLQVNETEEYYRLSQERVANSPLKAFQDGATKTGNRENT